MIEQVCHYLAKGLILAIKGWEVFIWSVMLATTPLAEHFGKENPALKSLLR